MLRDLQNGTGWVAWLHLCCQYYSIESFGLIGGLKTAKVILYTFKAYPLESNLNWSIILFFLSNSFCAVLNNEEILVFRVWFSFLMAEFACASSSIVLLRFSFTWCNCSISSFSWNEVNKMRIQTWQPLTFDHTKITNKTCINFF